MAYRISFLNTRPLVWTTFLSLMIHFLTLTVLFHWMPRYRQEPLVKRSETPEPSLVFEIVETGEESPLPPEETTLYSDRLSRARDIEPSNTEGQHPLVEHVSHLQRESDTAIPYDGFSLPLEGVSQKIRAPEGPSIEAPIDRSFFRRQRLLSEGASPSMEAINRRTTNGVEEFGAFSLNTYAWDYAPYLLDLKRRIEKNIFPPPVFTRMGSGGQNIFRFRIMPDGSLDGPILIRAEGEPALITTSENAIKFSTPFKPLPKDFPEPFLEITARFEYLILRP